MSITSIDFSTISLEIYCDYLEDQGEDTTELRYWSLLGFPVEQETEIYGEDNGGGRWPWDTGDPNHILGGDGHFTPEAFADHDYPEGVRGIPFNGYAEE